MEAEAGRRKLRREEKIFWGTNKNFFGPSANFQARFPAGMSGAVGDGSAEGTGAGPLWGGCFEQKETFTKEET